MRANFRLSIALALLLLLQNNASAQSWKVVAPMKTPRAEVLSVVLKDGRILVTGGRTYNNQAIKSTEIYDPLANTWSPAGDLNVPRYRCSIELLTDGRVVVAGGLTGPLATTEEREIFDPATMEWYPTTPLLEPRQNFPSVLLPDGRIIYAGGMNSNLPVTYLSSSEYFDPSTGAVGSLGNMPVAFYGNVLRYSKKLNSVVGAGGLLGGAGGNYLIETVLLSLTSNTWSYIGNLATPHANGRGQDIQLLNGTMLEVSGRTGSGTVTAGIERLNEGSLTWEVIGSLVRPHWHCKTLQIGDSLLVIAGLDDPGSFSNIFADCSWYDLKTNKSFVAPKLNQARAYHGAHLISVKSNECLNGRVIYAIGGEWKGQTLTSVERLVLDPNSTAAIIKVADDLANGSCDTLRSTSLISNPGCDSAEIIEAWFSGEDSDELTGDIRVPVPSVIAPSDSLQLLLALFGKPGTYYPKLNVRIRKASRIIDTFIVVKVVIIPSEYIPPIVSVNSFDAVLPCDSTTTEIILRSLSCYKFVVQKIELVGNKQAFDLPGQLTFPFTIAENGTWRLPLTYHPGAVDFDVHDSIFVTGYIDVDSGRVKIVIKLPLDRPAELTASSSIEVKRDKLTMRSSCDSLGAAINFINKYCRDLTITELRLLKGDGGFVLDTSGSFPLVLPSGEQREIVYLFQPNGKLGSFEDSLRITGFEMTVDGPRWFDTVVSVSAVVPASPPTYMLSAYSIDLPVVSTCRSLDTSLSLTNTGCDTLTITSAELGTAGFELGRLPLPLKLAPGESVKISITFSPQELGKQFGSIRVSAAHQGITKIIDIPLSGVGVDPEMALMISADAIITMPVITKCESNDTLIVIHNKGCDTIRVEIGKLGGATEITVTGGDFVLPPDSVANTTVICLPFGQGMLEADVLIKIFDRHGKFLCDSIIKVTNSVLPGSKILNSNTEMIDLGEMTRCETRSGSFVLMNEGCDTLIITSLDLDTRFATDATFPIMLGPGMSVSIAITVAGDDFNENVVAGAITVSSTADNQIASIAIYARIVEPRNITLSLHSEKPEGSSLDVVHYVLSTSGDLSGVSTIDLDLVYNTDLMGEGSFERGVVTTTVDKLPMRTRSLRLTGPFNEPEVLDRITFNIRLAEELTSPLLISNVTLNGGDADFAKCVATGSESGAIFNYVDHCGDQLVRDLWSRSKEVIGGVIRIGDELLIEHSARGEATFEIYDLLGRLRTTVKSDRAAARLMIGSISEGAYVLRMITTFTQQSRMISILR